MVDVPLNFSGLTNVLTQMAQGQQQLITVVQKIFPQTMGVSTTATGGSVSLPASAVGYLEVLNPVSGTVVKIPYYST